MHTYPSRRRQPHRGGRFQGSERRWAGLRRSDYRRARCLLRPRGNDHNLDKARPSAPLTIETKMCALASVSHIPMTKRQTWQPISFDAIRTIPRWRNAGRVRAKGHQPTHRATPDDAQRSDDGRAFIRAADVPRDAIARRNSQASARHVQRLCAVDDGSSSVLGIRGAVRHRVRLRA
jgi:hypothetical protein